MRSACARVRASDPPTAAMAGGYPFSRLRTNPLPLRTATAAQGFQAYVEAAIERIRPGRPKPMEAEQC